MNDKDRRDLFDAHRHLADDTARWYARRLRPLLHWTDLVAPALEGLWDAAGRWDPGQCPRFAAWAALRIRGAVVDWLRVEGYDRRRLRSDLYRRRPLSLEAPAFAAGTSGDGGRRTVTVAEMLEAPAAGEPAADLRDLLAVAMRCLPPRSRLILRLYYQECLTEQEIAAVLGISKSWVYQLHERALSWMRERLEQSGGE